MSGPAETLFRAMFGAEPEVVVRAPGRVNLIGEHTDYNEGFVLPAAIDLELELAARIALRTRVVSREEADAATYVRAVLQALGSDASLEVAVASDIPMGGGLSSSAALELAT